MKSVKKSNYTFKNNYISMTIGLILVISLTISDLVESTVVKVKSNLKSNSQITKSSIKKTNDDSISLPSMKNLLLTNDINSPYYHEFQWKFLFKHPDRPPHLCKKKVDLIPVKNKTNDDEIQYISSIVPKSKHNIYKEKNHGKDESAYMFDWLDGFLLKDVTALFKKYYDEAVKIPNEIGYPDIYNVTAQLNAYKTMGVGDFVVLSVHDTPEVQDKLLQNLAKINNKVKPPVYKAGISISQFSSLVTLWKWKVNRNEIRWQKRLFDKYDFDGDGRLSVSEFILFTIIHNHKAGTLGTETGTHNYLNVTREKIDGIFSYADCNGDGYISAEDLWYTLKEVKRSPELEGKFDMYRCDAYAPMNNEYRSASANDFVLKNSETMHGLLTIEEFRKGVLLGFWSRQVGDLEVMESDALNERAGRWSEDGKKDIMCDRIKEVKCINCDPTEYIHLS